MEDENMPKKGLAAMLIAGKGPTGEDLEESDESDEAEGEDIAVEDMMSALNTGDVEGFKIALNAFLDMR